MEIQKLKLVYFSPTGTTKTILQGIAQGIDNSKVELLDITKPSGRKGSMQTAENELLIVGVPVYMGRVPALVSEWLLRIKAHNTPTVCVVVYGNRAYDDALIELKDILVQQGCLPIAAAAFVGEHSFSSAETPIAHYRPDVHDKEHTISFGRKINEKLQSLTSTESIADINLPGNVPYGGATVIWDIDFIAVDDTCMQCGICGERCPVGAIHPENSNLIDIEKCITCCACIKSCPQNARTIKPGKVKDATIRLNSLYKEQKEPEYFF